MLNFHELFSGSFLRQLEINEDTLKQIHADKSDIRNHLRQNLPLVLKKKTNLDYPTPPKFFTQGSCRYKTLNMPAHVPPQQADIDDGCYLPTEDWLENYKQPKMASKDFFEAVETTLLPLCRDKHWKVDNTKATCVRIIVSDLVHIDIPLYAIPEKEFKKLIEAREKLAMDHRFMDSASSFWERLPTDSVMLAHRDKGWIKSDPRKIVDWFEDIKDRYRSQIVRIIRYLKAFRDYQWITGGPASLLIMVMASNAFDSSHEDRDDLALLHVCSMIPQMLRSDVVNPQDPDEVLTDRLPDREKTIQVFQELHDKLEKAIYHTDSPSEGLSLLSALFGKRILGNLEQIKKVSPEELISSSPLILTSDEIIRRTRAG